MPQARLPDINSSFNYYRGKAVMFYQAGNYSAAIGSLNSFNGDLQPKYRIEINTKKYNERIKLDPQIVCPECSRICPHCLKVPDAKDCKARTNLNDIVITQQYNSSAIQFITGKEFSDIWECPICNSINDYETSDKIQKTFGKPFFLQLIPDPPQEKGGLLQRRNYHREFSSWFWLYVNELEEAAARFRDDNWQKEDNEQNADSEINTDNEDSEGI